MKGFLNYIPGDSFLHKAHPLAKLFLAICICIGAFISNSYFFLISTILLNLILSFLCDIKSLKNRIVFKRTCKTLFGLIKVSLFLFILQVLLIRSGNPLFSIGSFSITDNGIQNGLLLVLRLTGATLPLTIIISITNLNDISNTLVKCLHLPYKYAFTFTTAIRFIPVFAIEMNNIMEAQSSRGVDFETKNPFKKIALVLPLCAPLLISSVRRIDSIAISTELKGFQLRNINSCSKTYKITLIDLCILLVSCLICALAIIIK